MSKPVSIRLSHTRTISLSKRESSECYAFEINGTYSGDEFCFEDLLTIHELIGKVIEEKKGKEVRHG